MPDVIRWGRSAYETDADLAREQAAAQRLGLSWRPAPDAATPDDLDAARFLVVTSGVRVSADVIARFGGELVLTTTSGWDHVDVEAARRRGVRIARCPLARKDAVVEQALTSMIQLRRRLPELDLAAREGRWARGELPALAPAGLSGATVVVVGLGVIGSVVAGVCRSLGARVLGVDPRGVPPGVTSASLDTALSLADVVTLHCALTPATRGLFDADALRALPRGAVVVNTARGACLDVDAAVGLVRDGHLGGLAVDVFPEEPYPRLAAAADLPGVWFTPHSAGYVRDLGSRVSAEVADTLAAAVAGRPLPHEVCDTP